MQKYTIRKIRKGHSLRKIVVEEILKTKLLRKLLVKIYGKSVRKIPMEKILGKFPNGHFLMSIAFQGKEDRRVRSPRKQVPYCV